MNAFVAEADIALDPTASPADEQFHAGAHSRDGAERSGPHTVLDVVEMVLKEPDRLNHLIRAADRQVALIPVFLKIALAGFSIFAVALTITFQSTGRWPKLRSIAHWLDGSAGDFLTFTQAQGLWGRWFDGSALNLFLAYNLGMVAALCICLPSYYFFSLLAGIRTSMLEVVAHSLKGMATTALALVGIVPVYLALALGFAIFYPRGPSVSFILFLGMILPFVAGLFALRSLYDGLLCLSDTLPPDRREHRRCFLRRLLFSWSGCYTAVCPVMIFTLWEHLGRFVGR